jgi:diphthine-ammonia ligase
VNNLLEKYPLKKNSVFSGGKDSTYNMIQCVRNGHELVALANLHPKENIGKKMNYSIRKMIFHFGFDR